MGLKAILVRRLYVFLLVFVVGWFLLLAWTCNQISELAESSPSHNKMFDRKTSTDQHHDTPPHLSATTHKTGAQHLPKQVEIDTRPPLETLLLGDNVTGNVQFLLDFAVIGHMKCATSTIMVWTGSHPQIQCLQHEVNDLILGQHAKFIRRLYNKLPPGPYKRGYKNPSEIRAPKVLKFYKQHFPNIKLIVGIRHPVRFFESLYNFRVQNLNDMLPAYELIGDCEDERRKYTCTEMAKFHKSLARLGKVKMTKREAQSQFKSITAYMVDGERAVDLTNPVFLYDTTELAENSNYSQRFRTSLQEFLDLSQPFPPQPHIKPGKRWKNETLQKEKDARKINICDDIYSGLREHLMDISRDVSLYIRKYFLNSSDVFVASREHFDEIMMTYTKDPCDDQEEQSKQLA